MNPTITLALLERKQACRPQLDAFRELFGESVEVTEALCVQHASVFNWGWAADRLLNSSARKAYNEAVAPAWKTYDEATALASKAYDEATALALKSYDKALAPASKAYDEARALASKAYDEARAPALKAYDEAVARAFALAFLSQGN